MTDPGQNGEKLVHQYIKNRSQRTKDRAIQVFLPLVKHIVGRLNIDASGSLRREDLYQFGIIGLLDALERFDPEYGVTFKTFAYRRIHGEIIDAIRKEGGLSRDQVKRYNEIIATMDKMRSRYYREPTVGEICEEMEISREDYYKALQSSNLNFTLSLDDTLYEDGTDRLTRIDVLPDEEQVPPDKQLELESLQDEIKRLLQKLPERQRLILALYYYEELTLADIGVVLDLSESRVSQLLNQTLAQVRSKLVH